MNAADHLLGKTALARYGSRVALWCGDEQISFAELAMSVRRAAAAWEAHDARPGDRVMILLRDTPEFVAAWLGALHVGVVAVAVNDKLPAAERQFVFEDCAARVFLAEDDTAALTRTYAGDKCVSLSAWRHALAAATPRGRAATMRPTDPAFWLYSSGTTGHPKGIVHTHKDVLPAGAAMREILGLDEHDTVVATSRLYFAYGLEHALLGPLALGASSVLCPDPPDAVEATRLVARHRPSAFFSVPSFYRRLLGLDTDALKPFRSVRYCIAAGERLPAQVLDRWHAATGGEILSLYGMSETFCVSLMTPPGTSRAARTGLPVAGVETRLLDDAGGQVMTGEAGVLWIRHPALATGYANRPEATREQFREGWFCTRDVFVRDAEGFFSHQGRIDEFIKIAGQWVQPGEVEEIAVAAGAVAEAACVRVSDSDGFERLALFVTSGADPAMALEAVQRACENALPRHKRPKWIRAVAELPRTATGKIQRFKLRELIERELAG
ncbi:MAG: AMP-binding protein [Betaproteobacteria bacterium]